MDRYADPDLSEVGVAVRRSDADAVPEWRQARRGVERDVPAESEERGRAILAGAPEAGDGDVESSDAYSAEDENPASLEG